MEILINNQFTNNLSILHDITSTKKYNKVSNSVYFNATTKSEDYSILDLKANIENNAIINYPYEFISLTNNNRLIPPLIKINLVDNINIPTQEDIFEHYNRDTGEITITEKLLFNEQLLPNTFPEHLYASVGQSKLLIFAILHEIGHALHHQLFLKQEQNLLIPSDNDFDNNNFLNLITNNGIYLLGKSEHNKRYDINHAMKYAIKEGFADLYACIGLMQIYPKDVALNFISEVIEARIIGNDHYYTIPTIKIFKNDFEKNNIKFTDFASMHNYIDRTLSETALKTMLEKLSSHDKKQITHNNAFAGFLTSLFKQCYHQDLISQNILEQANNINEVIQVLQLNDNQFNITLHNLSEDKESFNAGQTVTENMIKNIYQTQFLSSKLNELLVSQNKIHLENKIYLLRQHYNLSRAQSNQYKGNLS